MTSLMALLGALAVIASGVAGVFLRLANKRKAEAEHANDRADRSEATADAQRRANDARQQLGQQHRQERLDADEKADAGHRDQLDNRW